MTTLRSKDVPPEEIEQLRSAIYNLVDDHDVERDSPLLDALIFMLDTLTEGKDVTILAEPLPTAMENPIEHKLKGPQ